MPGAALAEPPAGWLTLPWLWRCACALQRAPCPLTSDSSPSLPASGGSSSSLWEEEAQRTAVGKPRAPAAGAPPRAASCLPMPQANRPHALEGPPASLLLSNAPWSRWAQLQQPTLQARTSRTGAPPARRRGGGLGLSCGAAATLAARPVSACRRGMEGKGCSSQTVSAQGLGLLPATLKPLIPSYPAPPARPHQLPAPSPCPNFKHAAHAKPARALARTVPKEPPPARRRGGGLGLSCGAAATLAARPVSACRRGMEGKGCSSQTASAQGLGLIKPAISAH